MAVNLEVEICAIEHAPYHYQAAEIVLPGEEGLFAILPGHVPLVAVLGAGVATVKPAAGGQPLTFAINHGLVRVVRNEVLVLCRTVEAGQDIDLPRAQAARDRAEKRLAGSRDDLDLTRAQAALRRAVTRIQAASGPTSGMRG